ncbi:MAG: DUF3108 domain-containing protein [Xanthobacteraceae bacterium]
MASFVISFRLALRAVAAAGAAVTFIFGVVDRAHAQGQLKAWYTASLSGIPIGTGSSFVAIGDDQYQIGVNGSTAGVVRLFSSGKGVGGASGSVVGGRPVTAGYEVTITNGGNPDRINIAFGAGTVKQVTPPQPPSPDRVPLTDAHYHGVTDPLTASLVRVDGTGDPVGPQACHGATAIFEGLMRFEVRREFKRMESVQAEEGYQGPAVVCAMYFVPIAGYNPGRAAIKYLAQLKEMEVWLAPIANTRILAPFRVSIPTPFGLGVLQATKFISVATPGRATNGKSQ